MPELSKATLLEIDNDNQPKKDKKPISVQFNPTSMRLQFTNESEGGKQSGRQARQYTGTGSTTLTADLVFDTADEGQTGYPVSVLERTKEVEYFMVPQGKGGKNQAPPRLRFLWGKLIVDGVLESLSVDLDHFASDGTPLRAKAALSIKGQHPEYQFNEIGPGANKTVGDTPAKAAAATAAQPGAKNNPLSAPLNGISNALGAINAASSVLNQRIVQALDGESLSQLAQRAGVDPAAWRALAGGVANPLSLGAGVEINVGAAAGIALGLGANAGVQIGAAGSTAARVGLEPRGDASNAGAQLDRGYALSGAGGVGAALETVKANAGAQGAHQARQAFVGASGVLAGHAAADAFSTAAGTTGARNQVFSLRADIRATTFGSGVPLRDRIQIAMDERANLLSGQARIGGSGEPTLLPPATTDPGVPAWRALPSQPATTPLAAHARGCGCGCSDGTRHS